MSADPQSGLRMLKRTWSGNKTESAGDAEKSASAPVVDLTGSPPTPLADVSNAQPAAEEKRRKLDSSWGPFVKAAAVAEKKRGASGAGARTSSASSLDALVRPLAGRPGVRGVQGGETRPKVAQPEGAEKRRMSRVFLSTEQQRVLEAVVKQGKNVFFTGSAGTGKSVLLRSIIAELKEKYRNKPDAVAVTASTGIAACNVGGITLHSFGGVGLARESPERLLSYVRRNRKATTRWMRTAVLIIDEISMIDPKLFEKLEAIARLIRKSPKVFGGIQIVATGDFFQLPPVSNNGDAQFVFESPKWAETIQQKFNLSQVFRQKDSSFVTMLNEMRFGKLSAETIQAFARLERVPELPPNITPTELFPLRRDVDRANQERLNALPENVRVYTSLDGGTLQGEFRDRVLENFLAPRYVHLKKGAQVMLIKNLEDTLVNGSIGTVLDFVDEKTFADTYGEPDEDAGPSEEAAERLRGFARGGDKAKAAAPLWPLVRFVLPNGGTRDHLVRPEMWKNEEPNGDVIASRTQVPLILAWAMSIHKSQGQTLTSCRIDLRRVFEKGQAYVALSRATSLDALQVVGFHPTKVMAHPKVIRWSRSEFESA